MSDRTQTPTEHPYELLAGYVDGSGSPQERRAVEMHLASCELCREEASLAATARLALASLPELDPPGLAEQGLAGIRGTPLRSISAEAEEALETPPEEQAPSIIGRRKMAWVPALAAAAIVVIAGAIALPLLLRGGGGGLASHGAPEATQTPTQSPIPVLIDVGASYTPATLDTLAKRLSPAARQALAASSGPGSTPPAFGSESSPSPGKVATGSVDRAESRTALACLVGGGGLEADAVPIYLEQATFKGVPSYIGAFARPGSRLNFVVVAVSVGTCQPLYTLSQPA